jgi:hypothetical protein
MERVLSCEEREEEEEEALKEENRGIWKKGTDWSELF